DARTTTDPAGPDRDPTGPDDQPTAGPADIGAEIHADGPAERIGSQGSPAASSAALAARQGPIRGHPAVGRGARRAPGRVPRGTAAAIRRAAGARLTPRR